MPWSVLTAYVNSTWVPFDNNAERYLRGAVVERRNLYGLGRLCSAELAALTGLRRSSLPSVHQLISANQSLLNENLELESKEVTAKQCAHQLAHGVVRCSN